jgi:FtsP/CotA-like multicopper oxidase with cupredoxin domain
MNERRSFFARLAGLGAAALAPGAARAQHDHHHHTPAAKIPSAKSEGVNLPVDFPDLPKLPYKMVDGWKEFHLIAEVVKTELMPGRPLVAWGYNGSVPGPTIEVNEGDKVRVVFENRLPEMTAVHWHGFEVPMEMDGSVGLGQDPVPPGGKYVYEFELKQHGTFFYHSHFAMQEMMGMVGMFIMHPKEPYTPKVDRDFGLVLQEWMLLPNNDIPNTLAMEFNWLSFNGKAGPACTPMIVKQGERVRIRMVNIGMDHHPIHLHGMQFVMTGTEGGRVPEHLWYPMNTIVVGVAQARNIEFEAKYVGDWMLHCHLPHHMMNQMIPMVGPVTHEGHGGHAHHHAVDSKPVSPGMEAYPKDDPEKKKVPGYPQDMWMVMDDVIPPKPENYGLRKGWTGAMMGMMTLVRVVTPEVYDKIVELKKDESKKAAPSQHGHHNHGAQQ